MRGRLLAPDEVRAVLEDLVRRLAARGDEASVYVIGGAALALINPLRGMTQDVDGYIRPVDASDVLADLQREHRLDDGWFNYKAAGFQPPVAGPEMWHAVHQHGSVTLYAANTDALLAMKLNAARLKDLDDICFLLTTLDIRSLAEAEDLFERFYPGDLLSDRAAARVTHCLGTAPEASALSGG